jgi:hypothetical protein
MRRPHVSLALALACVAASPRARADEPSSVPPRVVSLSRLWVDAPEADAALLIAPFAGRAGADLRGWNSGRYVFRPGLDVPSGGFDAYPRALPDGAPDFTLHLSDELAAGPMFAGNVDPDALIAKYPATIPVQLIGGKKAFFNDARLVAMGPVPGAGDSLVFYAEALDTRTARTYLGANRKELEGRPRYTGNLTWQPDAYTRLTLGARYDGVMTESYGLSSWVLGSAGRTRLLDESSLVATFRRQVSPRNEVSVTYDLVLSREDAKANAGLGVPGHYNLDTYQTWGNYLTTVRDRALTHRLDAHWSTFLGGLLLPDDGHTVTLGVQAEVSARAQDESLNGGFDFVDQVPVGTDGLRASTLDENDRSSWALLSSDRGDELHAKTRQVQAAAYLTDQIAFGSSLRITPGLRFERFEGGFQGGPTVWRTNTLAPRLGAVWDADVFTTLFLDAGRHYQALDPSMYVRARQGAAYSALEYWDWAPSLAAPAQTATDPSINDPGWVRSAQFPAVVGDLRDVKHPYVDRLVAGVTHRFDPIHLKAKLRYEYRHFGDMIAITDTGGAYDPKTYTVANGGPKDSTPVYALQPGSHPRYAIENAPDARREYHSISLAVSEEIARWLLLRGALTWTSDRGNLDTTGGLSTEWVQPSGRINSYGNMGADSWVARVGATIDLPFAVRSWVDYSLYSGQYYSRVFRIRPSDLCVPSSDGRAACTQEPRTYVYDADGRGGHQYPARHVIDLGASRDVGTFGRGRLSAWVQVYNLLNASTVVGVREPSTFFNAVKSIEAPREIHLGVRYDL